MPITDLCELMPELVVGARLDAMRVKQLTGLDIQACVQDLLAIGLESEYSRSSGLVLTSKLEPLEYEHIYQSYLSASTRGDAQFRILPFIDSTNRELLQSGYADDRPRFLLAEFQTAGRGRRQRSWLMPYASGIAMSMQASPSLAVAKLPGLSLVIGIAVANCLQNYSQQQIYLKWPNDLVTKQAGELAKLGGILVETLVGAEGVAKVVVGLGLNYQQPDSKLDFPLSHLSALMQSQIQRNHMIGLLAASLEQAYTNFVHSGLPMFMSDWQRLDVLLHQKIVIEQAGRRYLAKAQGINQQGGLIIETDGEQHIVTAADTSIRLAT